MEKMVHPSDEGGTGLICVVASASLSVAKNIEDVADSCREPRKPKTHRSTVQQTARRWEFNYSNNPRRPSICSMHALIQRA